MKQDPDYPSTYVNVRYQKQSSRNWNWNWNWRNRCTTTCTTARTTKRSSTCWCKICKLLMGIYSWSNISTKIIFKEISTISTRTKITTTSYNNNSNTLLLLQLGTTSISITYDTIEEYMMMDEMHGGGGSDSGSIRHYLP